MSQTIKDNRDFIIAVNSELDDYSALTSRDFRVYCHLARRAGSTFNAWPSYQSIGDKCFSAESTSKAVRKRWAMEAVDNLVRYNLVTKQLREDDNGGKTSNNYYLTPKSQWGVGTQEYLPSHSQVTTPSHSGVPTLVTQEYLKVIPSEVIPSEVIPINLQMAEPFVEHSLPFDFGNGHANGYHTHVDTPPVPASPPLTKEEIKAELEFVTDDEKLLYELLLEYNRFKNQRTPTKWKNVLQRDEYEKAAQKLPVGKLKECITSALMKDASALYQIVAHVKTWAANEEKSKKSSGKWNPKRYDPFAR